MSNNTLNAALRRLGYGPADMTAHGFRSMASTLLTELGWSSDAVERQLAHGERDGVRAVYNYAQYLPERRRMMQAWSDYMDHLRTTSCSCCALSQAGAVGGSRCEQGPRATWLGPRRITPTWADELEFLPGAVELGERTQTDPLDDI
ncbi:MAG: tyrosine-type recombinase/integrase [Steroidobacteraceae bacterium]